jgi:hypothetical protein
LVDRLDCLSSNVKIATEVTNSAIFADLCGVCILRLSDDRNQKGIAFFDTVDLAEEGGRHDEKQ